jgi:RNA polymerase sigma-70 factor (ECF subfamily)
LAGVRPQKGRFRSFLLAALKHYAADRYAYEQRQRRRPNQAPVSIDAQDAEGRYLAEPRDVLDPARLYDRQWAMTLIERVLARLEREYQQSGQGERYELLNFALHGERPAADYRALGRQLGITENAVAKAVSDLKKRFRALLKAEVLDTVSNQEEAQDELQHLRCAICS